MVKDPSAYTFTRITLPGIDTVPLVTDINNRGDIVGEYDALNGFLLRNGEVTILDVPGSIRTIANGVNDRGEVVGVYLDPDSHRHGFLYSDGDYTLLDVPGFDSTALSAINNRGQIVGSAYSYGGESARGAYIYDRGAFSEITVPGNPDAFLVPEAINDCGVIVGTGGDPAFVLDRGELTLVDNPVSQYSISFRDVNNKGEVAGTLSPVARIISGFVYEDGEFRTVEPPQEEGRSGRWTVGGINDASALVGNYDDLIYSAPGEIEGNYAFLATPKAAAPPQHAKPAVDWDALAARVEANFAATGKWFVPDDLTIPAPTHPTVDWNALAAQVRANFAETGTWYL